MGFFLLLLPASSQLSESSSDAELDSDDGDSGGVPGHSSVGGFGVFGEGTVLMPVGPRMSSVLGARKGMLGRRVM